MERCARLGGAFVVQQRLEVGDPQRRQPGPQLGERQGLVVELGHDLGHIGRRRRRLWPGWGPESSGPPPVNSAKRPSVRRSPSVLWLGRLTVVEVLVERPTPAAPLWAGTAGLSARRPDDQIRDVLLHLHHEVGKLTDDGHRIHQDGLRSLRPRCGHCGTYQQTDSMVQLLGGVQTTGAVWLASIGWPSVPLSHAADDQHGYSVPSSVTGGVTGKRVLLAEPRGYCAGVDRAGNRGARWRSTERRCT